MDTAGSVKREQTRKNSNRLTVRRVIFEYAGLVSALVGLMLFFSALAESFFTLRSLSTIANQTADLTVIAVGMTFVLLMAGIDLSVGSVLAFCGTALGVALVDWGWSILPAIMLAVGIGLSCGVINGAVSVLVSIPSFIVTLAMLEIARGAAFFLADSQTKYIGTRLEPLGAPLDGIGLSPAFVVSVLIVGIGQLVLSTTVFGRYMFATGGNAQAAYYSGIPVKRLRITSFAILGALTGLAGVFHASRLAAADPNAGIGLELSAIAAVVIGGTSLAGGRGSVVRTFLGVIIIAVLQSGLAQVGATEPAKRIITGMVIVLAVVIDAYRHRFLLARTPSLFRKRLTRHDRSMSHLERAEENNDRGQS